MRVVKTNKKELLRLRALKHKLQEVVAQFVAVGRHLKQHTAQAASRPRQLGEAVQPILEPCFEVHRDLTTDRSYDGNAQVMFG